MFGILLGITIRQKTNSVCIFQISILLQIKYIMFIAKIFELPFFYIVHLNCYLTEEIKYCISFRILTIETSNIGGCLICQLSSAHLLGN